MEESLVIELINRTFRIHHSLVAGSEVPAQLDSGFGKLYDIFERGGYVVRNPRGEEYTETRTDCEATVVGDGVDNLVVTDVIKPIIYHRTENTAMLLQRGVVFVESKS